MKKNNFDKGIERIGYIVGAFLSTSCILGVIVYFNVSNHFRSKDMEIIFIKFTFLAVFVFIMCVLLSKGINWIIKGFFE